MKIIKVIDLLNMIANKESLPARIRFISGTYKEDYRNCHYDGFTYVYDVDGEDVYIGYVVTDLNDRIEILDCKGE